MRSSDPLHIAFVWHMHQPYYRQDPTAPFDMPWARMHALKDYLDMVETLSSFPTLHHTFNLVPSLVEQLETYAQHDFADVYWQHTLKPAEDLDPPERAFVLQWMCETSDHPRARSHPRYLELARKREAQASHGWDACASAFTVDEIRDLQVWFNLAWFDPQALEASPLSDLIHRGRDFHEDDKGALAEVQRDILKRTLPAYREAAAARRIEISTSPYYHPILPLLSNTDSARVAAADTTLPQRRFAHPEDAVEQLRLAVAKHEQVFGSAPRGVWCSEQAVGEDVIPMLLSHGFEWTISDETVLARSLAGVERPDTPWRPGPLADLNPHGMNRRLLSSPFLLRRDEGEMAVVFRDHTLSDLIGFAYNSWDSKEAAADLIRRLREIRGQLLEDGSAAGSDAKLPLVTIALDGENAWEYYPRDGRDFLHYLYEELTEASDLRCVTVSEHLEQCPPSRSLDWLHTGSWIGGDLRTWIGDVSHGIAWDLLHDARDAVQAQRRAIGGSDALDGDAVPEAWQHILAAEGSDWFWWFGDHHHTNLDSVWDLSFRRHLQEAYRLVGAEIPSGLLYPILDGAPATEAVPPTGPVSPVIDGVIGPGADGYGDEWESAGRLSAALPSTMQRAEETSLQHVRYGWKGRDICVLISPDGPAALEGLEIRVLVIRPYQGDDVVFSCVTDPGGEVGIECRLYPQAAVAAHGAWNEVIEISLPVPGVDSCENAEETGLMVRLGRGGMTEHVYHTARVGSEGWRET